METGNATLIAPGPGTTRRNSNVAVLTDRPDGLARLEGPLRRFAGAEIDSVHVWVAVERFRSPSSTPYPYRNLGRIEARNITADRLTQAELDATVALSLWSTAAPVSVEAITDATAAALVERLARDDIDLLVCDAASGVVALAEQVAALTGRPVLLISDGEGDSRRTATAAKQVTNPAARLLRAIHG